MNFFKYRFAVYLMKIHIQTDWFSRPKIYKNALAI